ncbi:YslB family protein [Apilactobacillus sp. TMW 2.2459]|uniref:DUF2507 domain-containing protein n=1 Tax=Apilactobacillus xinyiensis TaxID=2841032 RepID=UPI001C7D501D|nr:DUF2507 domain-containing protein [Apilactobacillus xinyiensis]MCL0312332.1 YslB family protein [Apilactobacillus xinyiensis]
MSEKLYQSVIKDDDTKDFWGELFLRDELIKDLLGKDNHNIMYWAGKKMARKFKIKDALDLIIFFKQTGLGILELKSESTNCVQWNLSGKVVDKRIKNDSDADFMFEAGFLAQITEQQMGVVAEAEMNPKEDKNGVVLIRVHMDQKQPSNTQSEENDFEIINK